jgi:hypothetical protein
MEPITPISVYRDHYSPGAPDKKGRDHKYVPIKLGGLSNAPEKYRPEINKGWIQEDPGSSMMIYNEALNYEGAVYHLSHNFYDVYVRVGEDPKFLMLLTCPYDILQKRTKREKWIKSVCFTLTSDPCNISDLISRGYCPALEAPIKQEDPVNLMGPAPELENEPVKKAVFQENVKIEKIEKPRPGWISWLRVFIEEIPAGAPVRAGGV